MIDKKEVITSHINRSLLEIAKIDDAVTTNVHLPIPELMRHHKKRNEIGEVMEFLKYLLHVEGLQQEKQKEQGKIIIL